MARFGMRRHGVTLLALCLLICRWNPQSFPHSLRSFVGASSAGVEKRLPCRASDFEAGLSLEDMLQLVEERKERAKEKISDKSRERTPPISAPLRLVTVETTAETAETAPTEVLVPEVLTPKPSFGRLERVAELPCVFTPSEQGERPIGVEIELRFWQDRYWVAYIH